jgi:CBS domain-containing protein
MSKHHVRRLTVLDKEGHLQGVLSMDDIVQAPGGRGTPTTEEIVDALKGVYKAGSIEDAVA